MDKAKHFFRPVGCYGRLRCIMAAGALAVAAMAGAQPAAPSIAEVQAGDTFSGIAARYTGNPANWRKVYREQLSKLPNPNVISVGMRFELVSAADGSQYLRLMPGRSAQTDTTSVASIAAANPGPATAAPAKAAAPSPSPSPAPGQSGELVIGVVPNIPAAQLTPAYEHLRRYLERGGETKVRIVIPANFKAFFDATMKGDYDLAVAAPNLARVAQADRNMLPLVVYEPRINALFVTPIDTTITNPRDVRERAVAFANPTSLGALYGQKWLRQQGLEPDKDYVVGPAKLLLCSPAASTAMRRSAPTESRRSSPTSHARFRC